MADKLLLIKGLPSVVVGIAVDEVEVAIVDDAVAVEEDVVSKATFWD